MGQYHGAAGGKGFLPKNSNSRGGCPLRLFVCALIQFTVSASSVV